MSAVPYTCDHEEWEDVGDGHLVWFCHLPADHPGDHYCHDTHGRPDPCNSPEARAAWDARKKETP